MANCLPSTSIGYVAARCDSHDGQKLAGMTLNADAFRSLNSAILNKEQLL